MYVLMSHKSHVLYTHLFNTIKNILKISNINVDFDKIIFTIDFEKAIRKAIIEIFPNSNILGCFFHFVKALCFKEKNMV